MLAASKVIRSESGAPITTPILLDGRPRPTVLKKITEYPPLYACEYKGIIVYSSYTTHIIDHSIDYPYTSN